MKGKLVRINVESIYLRFIQMVLKLHSQKIYIKVTGDSCHNCRNPK